MASKHSADEGARHACGTEDEPGPPHHASTAGVAYHAHGRGDADDKQGCGDRFLSFESGYVDQDGNGQDGTAAA